MLDREIHILEEIRDLIKCILALISEDQQKMDPKYIWLDNQDLMQMLHVSARTLQRWRDEKIIPFTKIKGKIWYKKEEVDELLRSRGIVLG